MSAPNQTKSINSIMLTMSVVHAAHSRNSHTTHLYFDEPLLSTSTPDHSHPSRTDTDSFRRFATLNLPGHCTDLSFFRQTIAAVAEKQFIIAEPGNPACNPIPTFPPELDRAPVTRMINASGASSGALGMYQIKENEFLLVYQWGACYVTKCEFDLICERSRRRES